MEAGKRGASDLPWLLLLLGDPPPRRQPGACVTQWPQGQHSKSRAAGPARHTRGIRLRRPGCGPSRRGGRQSERLLGSHHELAEEQAERGPACREEGPLPPQSPQRCSAWPRALLRQTHPPEAAHSQRTPGPAQSKSGYSQPRVSGSVDARPALRAATQSAHRRPGNGGLSSRAGPCRGPQGPSADTAEPPGGAVSGPHPCYSPLACNSSFSGHGRLRTVQWLQVFAASPPWETTVHRQS